MIITENWCAEFSVQETAKKFSELFSNMSDDYMKSRAVDVIDVSERVIDILLNRKRNPLTITEPCILYADDFTPSETAQLDRSYIQALISANGSTNSHTAIFARNMGIPAVIGVGDGLREVCDGTIIGVVGDDGMVYVQPDRKTLEYLSDLKCKKETERTSLNQLIGKSTVTTRGNKVKLYANIGGLSDIDTVIANDAEGIGLLRSEFLYLESEDYPSEQKMFEAYQKIAQKMNNKQIIIRTLDIGADKQADYFNIPIEENPAMGMRAIRVCLQRPQIFRTQLRAILRASAYGNIAVMFPMITSLSEINEAKQLLEQAKAELDIDNVNYDTEIQVGIMIETPASAVISDVLASEVDFFSIGTNDLTQYTLAADRQNDSISRFVDPYHPAVMRLIGMTIKNAKAAGILVGICGELASDTKITQELLDMGIDELSVSPSRILSMRNHIRNLL
jgi:phosphotransferase system enzyme I (PtsI)